MKNWILLLSVLVGVMCSCERLDTIPEQTTKKKITNIDIASFSSREALLNAILESENATKDGNDESPDVDLFTDPDEVDYENDPILSIDFQFIDDSHLLDVADYEGDEDYGGIEEGSETEEESSSQTIYEALGYDELIPNRSLARMMNARAEVMVQDTIYKVSHRGTYFYPAIYKEEFEQSYESFENSDGTLIDSLLYQMSEHVFRYSTFDGDFYEEGEDNLEEGADDEEDGPNQIYDLTKAPTIVPFSNLNWNSFPRENISSHTWVGKIIESIIGRNKAYTYNYNNRTRFYAKFYYFNYWFYQESGVVVKTQRKPFLLWKATNAQELFAGIHGVLYQMTIPSMNPIPNTNFAGSVTESLPFQGGSGEVSYFICKTITYNGILSLLKGPTEMLFSELRRITGHDASRSKVLKFFVDSKLIVYIPAEYIYKTNTDQITYNLYKFRYFGVDGLNLLNLPNNAQGWIAAVARSVKNSPKFKLLGGEVRAAAKYDGQIKAVSLYKPYN